jgi:hypothetical protein
MPTETSIIREAPFLEDIRKRLLTSAEGLTKQPVGIEGLLPQGQLAPFPSATTQAFDLAQTGLGGFQPFLTDAAAQQAAAAGQLAPLAERGPGRLEEARAAALLGAGDITSRIGAFQDPFQQQVIDRFSEEATRQNELAKIRFRDTAIKAGGFGGLGRFGGEAELESRLQQILQQQQAGLLSQGYTTALGAAEREAARLQALPGQLSGIEQLQYQLPGSLAGQQQNLATAQAGLGGLTQQLGAQDVALLSQVGSQQQAQGQRRLDLERQNQLQQLYEPYQRIGFLGDILKGQPSATSTLTQSTEPRANPLSQILGAGISLAGIFGPGGFGQGYLFNQPGSAGTLSAGLQSALR